jgi:hypothetical protein
MSHPNNIFFYENTLLLNRYNIRPPIRIVPIVPQILAPDNNIMTQHERYLYLD